MSKDEVHKPDIETPSLPHTNASHVQSITFKLLQALKCWGKPLCEMIKVIAVSELK
jgi:hypothetical protein